ncbi:MAG: PepSY domain-containing protein [Roseiflexaceae bacterium]|nr:PepSY domain-containing protein [Roseiflexaceae bacterium]
MLAEATVKLEQANAQIVAANARLSQPNQSAAPASPASPDVPAYAITAGQAEAAALQAYPNATLTRMPEVVDYQGTLAYEVTLDQGTLYVDAQTGTLLADGVVAQQPQPSEPHADDDEQDADERDEGNQDDQDDQD